MQRVLQAKRCVALVLGFFLVAPTIASGAGETAASTEQPSGRPTLRAGSLPPGLILDGRASGPAWWAATDSISNLTTIEPEEGGVPAGRTIVKVLVNRDAIVVGARCYDGNPGQIVSFSKSRDSELEEQDHLVIVLDPFLDGRSGFVFAVNPSGARFDGLVVARGEEVNSDWDTIWEAKTSRDDAGWYAEIRIPIQSLTFKQHLTHWGFNVQRRVQRLQETSRWSGANLDYEVTQTSRSGLLSGIPEFELGLGLSIRPAVVGRVGRPGPHSEAEADGDLSLDVTKQLGASLMSALTINTDFAETEVDVRRINLTRFPVFFPEKRTFFLAGADVFEFGLGLDEENLLPFSSRRIGLFGVDEDDQLAIPVNLGAKLSGHAGSTSLGALAVDTRKADRLPFGETGQTLDVPQTTMAAFRLKQDVLEESALGLLATFGDQLGRSESWTAGMDFTYQTSEFQDEKNLLVGFWGLLNDRPDLRGDKSAAGIRLDYPNDLLDMNLSSIRIGDGFDPSLGFVPRRGVHIWDFGSEFNPRGTWPTVHQMFYELSFTLFNNLSNERWESYAMTVKPLDWLLASGDRFEASIEPEGDRPRAEFEVADDVDIAPGSYEWTRYVVAGRSAAKRRLSGGIRWETGEFYNGRLNTLEASLALKPSALFMLELTGERSVGRVLAPEDESVALFEKHFTEAVYGIRVELNFSPDLQVSSLTQYEKQTGELGTNNRLRWTFSPRGDLFLVYNQNGLRTVGDRWNFISNQAPAKIQYTWRF